MAEMLAVLDALMSHDNKARGEAEAFFQSQLEANATGVVQQLLEIFGGNGSPVPSEVIRSFAGVLLRRAVEKTNFAPEINDQLRGMLITIWKAEKNPLLLKRLAHVMSQSALSSSWMNLLPQVIENVRLIVSCFLHRPPSLPFRFLSLFSFVVLTSFPPFPSPSLCSSPSLITNTGHHAAAARRRERRRGTQAGAAAG